MKNLKSQLMHQNMTFSQIMRRKRTIKKESIRTHPGSYGLNLKMKLLKNWLKNMERNAGLLSLKN